MVGKGEIRHNEERSATQNLEADAKKDQQQKIKKDQKHKKAEDTYFAPCVEVLLIRVHAETPRAAAAASNLFRQGFCCACVIWFKDCMFFGACI
jgi:hypothetical protein